MTESRFEALWQPFTPTGSYAPKVMVEAKGCEVTDANGKVYLDGVASLWNVMIGHGRREIAEAVTAQMGRLEYFSLFGYTTEPALELAGRITALAPEPLDHVFLTSSGSEAVDTALKVARGYWKRRGHGGKYKFISRLGSYHGVNFGGTSVQGIARNRVQFEPLLPGCFHIPAMDAEALEREIAFQGPDTVAAFIAEPVLGAAGVFPPPDNYLADVRAICARHDVLLILDEVITGFGRLGTWFGSQYYDVTPDIITFAKGVTSGYLPMGGVLASTDVYRTFVDTESPGTIELPHGYTYSGHPAACAAALANLDIMEKEDIVGQGALAAARFQGRLRDLGELDSVREVRGVGLLAGITPAAGADAVKQAVTKCWDDGVIVRSVGEHIVCSPPLVITDEQIDRLFDALASALG